MALSKKKAGKKPVMAIALCGGTASGKSWLAKYLVRHLSGKAVVLCQDWYYRDHSRKSKAECEKLNFDHPSAIETPLLLKQLRALLAGKTIQTPRYRYSTHSRDKQTRPLEPAPIVIVEGLFVLHEKRIREKMDLTVFIDVPADERLVRRIRRDVEERRVDLEETLRLYEGFVRPMHEKYIQPSAKRAKLCWRQEREPDFPEELLVRIRARLRRLA